MSLDLSYVVPGVNLPQLQQELIKAGLVPEMILREVVTVPDPSPPAPPDAPTDTYEETVLLYMPDGTSEAAVDAVVAAHVPQAVYDPATVAAAAARTREAARLRADYERLLVLFRAVGTAPDAAAAIEAATVALIEVLKRRDRAAGVYY